MRYALGIEYDGTGFFGWQRLAHGSNIQAEVEAALSFVANHEVAVTCAGRTDAGVHARCQVVHFDSESRRNERAWTLGANTRLPIGISVLWARPVPDDFHARFSARARRYRYTLLNRAIRPALDARYVSWERRPLGVEAMHRAAQALIGEHDFSAFRAISCQAAHARRCVLGLSVTRMGEHVHVDVEANAFLHHMVRNIVGSLLEVGTGERPAEWIAEVLASRDRAQAGATAPSQGLTFIGPRYPAEWALPPEVTLSNSKTVRQ